MAEQRVTGGLAYAVTAAVLGMLQFGYNTGVINAPEELIKTFIQKSYEVTDATASTLFAVAVSAFAVGGIIGCPLGSWLSEKRGRRGALLINCVLGIFAAALMGFSRLAGSYEMLVAGRLLVGVNCGLATTVAPTYVSEVAPVRLRGAFGTVNQLAVTSGITLSQTLGIDALLGTTDTWALLLGLSVVPALLQLALLPACPETPRHLLMHERDEDRARAALTKLRGTDDIEEEIEDLRAEDRANRTEEKLSLRALITSPALRAPLIIGVMMHLSQQLSGINAILYYSSGVFVRAGLDIVSARHATIGVGGVLVLMALVTVPIMDRAGRRTLHLVGLGGMFVFSLLMTVGLLTSNGNNAMGIVSVVFTLGYVASFGLGPGSIPWMITSELFSQNARSTAVGVGTFVNWLANFAVSLLFPTMQAGLGDYTFLPFSVLLALFFAFLFFKLPETKNKTIEEITSIFKK